MMIMVAKMKATINIIKMNMEMFIGKVADNEAMDLIVAIMDISIEANGLFFR